MDPVALHGRTLGVYELEGLIHQGQMATVFHARDTALGRNVAVKVIARNAAADRGGTDGRTREGEWLMSCADPHIVRVYGTGMIDGLPFIVMEWLPLTLAQWLERGPLDLEVVVEVGAGMLLGLAAAHRAGILHGDLKPANVGVDARGAVKLLDFGAATLLPWHSDVSDRVTEPLPFGNFGTLHYMAPEQLLGHPLDERTDIYGVGAVLHELATGQPPFAFDQPAAVVAAILGRRPSAPSTVNGPVSVAFDEVIRRALAKRPSSRFPSVWAMMDALLAVRMLQPETFQLLHGTRVSSDRSRSSNHGRWRFERTVRSRVNAIPAGTSAGG